MKKLLSITIVIALGLIGSVSAASVSDLKLSYENNTTVATIVIDGQVRFTHETVEAKEGKPFRVVVDVLSVVHNLPQKDFLSLPKCAVSSIRTSQYSVQPERVVRLVFDMSKETVYRVDSDAHTIKLYFADKNLSSFANWSAQKKTTPPAKKKAPVAAKTPVKTKPATFASINKSFENDRQESLQSSAPVTKATEKSAAKTKTVAKVTKPSINKSSVKKASKIEVPYGPEFASNSPFETTNDTPVKTEKKEAIKTSKVQPKAQPDKKPATVVSQTSNKSVKPLIKAEAATKPKPSTKVSVPAKPKPVVKKKAKVLASVSNPALKTVSPALASKAEVKSKVAAKPQPKAEVGNKPKSSALAEKKSNVKVGKKIDTKKLASVPVKKPTSKPAQFASKPAVKKQPAQAAKKSAKKVVAQKPVQKTLALAPVKSTKASEKVVKKAKSKKQSTQVATKPVAKKKSTSRFRRNPNGSSKIKGTLVAQFPKRLVIKYKGRSRDPFETLIDETRVDNNPVERRAPNVEGLKLVGIIEAENGENRALFEDKNNFGYILKGGDKVQKGYVLRVEDDRVYFQIFEYGWSRTVALNIEDN